SEDVLMSRSPASFAFHPRSKFDAFLEGQLSASADERMRAHLAACEQCAKEVEQRWSALTVTQEFEKISGHEPRSYPALQSTPIMESSGLAGWKFLVGAGIVGLVVCGVFASLWILGGDDRMYESAGSDTPALIPDEIEI